MLKVLRECALDASLKILYEACWNQWSGETGYVMADGVLELPNANEMIQESAVEYLRSQSGVLVRDAVALMAMQAAMESEGLKWVSVYDRGAMPVYWVTDPPILRSGKGFEKTIQTYGNEPALDVVYWHIWIFARVGPAGRRETANA